MEVGQTFRSLRTDREAERIARADRATVYAVATAARMGREDLAGVRQAAELEDESDEAVRLARWFDAATFPPPARRTVAEALGELDGLGFSPEVVAAFREVQPLIQPVGLE